jgi:hypothetical protein
MRLRAPRIRLTAVAALAAVALLGVDTDTDIAPLPDPAPVNNPAIYNVVVTPDHLRAGSEFEVTIYTTPEVTSLQACVMKYKLPVPKTSDGIFYASARVPWWAGIYHGTFHVVFVAEDADGAQAQMEADIRI